MIPKKIHYCWFGGNPLPDSAIKCINSWKKYFPEYEIIQWDENNFDITFNKYAFEAYNNKKYAFFTDVARLYIIYTYGGIYFDVDVEVIKKYNDLIECEAFFGIESERLVNTGLGFGAEKGNKLVKELLDDYNNISFIQKDNTLDLTTCPIRNSEIFKKHGFVLNNKVEVKDNVVVYSKDFFNPFERGTGKLNINENTHSIHWFNTSWQTNGVKMRIKLLKPIRRIFGMERYNKLKEIILKIIRRWLK